MSYTMYTPLNVWLNPASVTDVVAYIQTYLSENTIYSETEIETIIHDYLIAHPELIGGVQSVNGKTGTVVLSASDINTENNVTIESVLASLSSQISSIAASVATNTANITSLTGRVSTAETDISNLKSNLTDYIEQVSDAIESGNVITGIVNVSISSTGTYTTDTTSKGVRFKVETGKRYGFYRLNTNNVVISWSPRIVICDVNGTVLESYIATGNDITIQSEGASYGYAFSSGYTEETYASAMVLIDFNGLAPSEYIGTEITYKIKDIPSKTSELINDSGFTTLVKHKSQNIADFNTAYGFYISGTGAITVDPATAKGYKVPVKNGTTYGFYRLNSSGTVISWIPRVSVVDVNDTLLTFQNATANTITISNSNAAYMYVWSSGYTDDVVQTCMILEDFDGTAPTKYIRYYSYNSIDAVSRTRWYGKNALIYGDSITAQGNTNSATGFFYGAEITHGFNKVYYRGVGGQTFKINTATFYANSDGSYNSRDAGGNPPAGTTEHLGYFASWDRITAMIPEGIRKTIDLVVVSGGTNDFKAIEDTSAAGSNIETVPEWVANNSADAEWAASSYYIGGDYNLATLAGAMASCFMKLQIWCPNALIVFGTPFARYDLTTMSQTVENNVTFREFCEIEIDISKYMAIPVIDANAESNITIYNYEDCTLTDNTHPNETGRLYYGRPYTGSLYKIYPLMI